MVWLLWEYIAGSEEVWESDDVFKADDELFESL